ncbi:hypothetical protein AHAS_Ahas16G0135000 [Arachis hypogaea]
MSAISSAWVPRRVSTIEFEEEEEFSSISSWKTLGDFLSLGTYVFRSPEGSSSFAEMTILPSPYLELSTPPDSHIRPSIWRSHPSKLISLQTPGYN